jgi:hypothetical protein
VVRLSGSDAAPIEGHIVGDLGARLVEGRVNVERLESGHGGRPARPRVKLFVAIVRTAIN